MMSSVTGADGAGVPGRIRLLIVCMWPLGGIRTYLKYNYRLFPPDKFDITLLANPVIEKEAVKADMEELGIRVVWAPPIMGKDLLFPYLLQLRWKEKFDLIHSQGFLSAFQTALVNRILHLPHVMTMHGVLEEKRFAGRFGGVKRALLQRVLADVDVFVGVGRDILSHVREGLPGLQHKSRWVVIRNGIDTAPFLKDYPGAGRRLREAIGIKPATYLFGYFGRFMPEKGFPYLVEAAKLLAERSPGTEFAVLAVGSGDYEKQYREKVEALGVRERFCFMPFQPNVAELMQGCDSIIMPSVWEAYPLLTSEVLCCGVPIIATDCPGLREAVEDTPALSVSARDAAALANGMEQVMGDGEIAENFRRFRTEAGARYNVARSAEALIELFQGMTAGGSG